MLPADAQVAVITAIRPPHIGRAAALRVAPARVRGGGGDGADRRAATRRGMAEVDFGLLGLWPDPPTGRRYRVYGILVTLG